MTFEQWWSTVGRDSALGLCSTQLSENQIILLWEQEFVKCWNAALEALIRARVLP